MPLLPGGASVQPRQHEMDDVVGQLVLAVGDEDLLPGDAIGAVGSALGLGAQRADVGAGLRLGELHGAHPFAGRELGQIGFLERVRAVSGERLDRAHGQHRPDAERHRRAIPHLDAGGVERMRQRLAAESRGRRHRVPAALPPGLVGLLPARRHGDAAVLERRAVLVADRIERCDHVAGEAARLGKHGIDVVAGKFIGCKTCAVLESERDVGNRRAEGHDLVRRRQRLEQLFPLGRVGGKQLAECRLVLIGRLH